MHMETHTIHIVGGPTASGKSAHAITLAQKLDGVVINCDSRQIYSDLPILTAQPSQEDQNIVPHALYGAIHPNELCSAGAWVRLVSPIIEQTLQEGKTPIITGGNGLYIKALIEGLSPISEVPEEIRQQAIAKQLELGNPGFYEALQQRDPETAALYHPMHTSRLIHAWEILEATGKPLAQWQQTPKIAPPSEWLFDITLVMPERATLYDRCNQRFQTMLDMGAMEELNAFDQKITEGEYDTDCTLVKTVGANPLRRYRDGEILLEDAIALAQIETRQYAKRQTTWFNNQVVERHNISLIKKIV
jgi:tRNA dimethylallyltransferase